MAGENPTRGYGQQQPDMPSVQPHVSDAESGRPLYEDADQPVYTITSLAGPPKSLPMEQDRITIATELLDRQNALAAAARREQSLVVRLSSEDGKTNQLEVQGRPFAPTTPPNDPLQEVNMKLPARSRGVVVPTGEVPTDQPITAVEQSSTAKDPHGHWKALKPTAKTPSNDRKGDVSLERILEMSHPALPIHLVLNPQETPYKIQLAAQALSQEEIMEELVRVKQRHSIVSPQKGMDAEAEKEQLARRHNELKVALDHGSWDTRLAVGSVTQEEADNLAARMETYLARPDSPVLWKTDPRKFSTVAEAMANATGIPLSTRDMNYALPMPLGKEISGIPVVRTPESSVNIDNVRAIPAERRYSFGNILDGQKVGEELVADTANDPEHSIVSGASGTGKTTLIENKIVSVVHKGKEAARKTGDPSRQIGATIINPKVGQDYQSLVPRLAETGKNGEPGIPVTVIKIGDHNPERPIDEDAIPVGIDPIKIFPGESEKDADARFVNQLLNAFSAGGNVDTDMLSTVETYVRDTMYGYERKGKREPGFREYAGAYGQTIQKFVDRLMQVAEGYGYVDKGQNLPQFLGAHVGSLTSGHAGEFFEGTPIDLDKDSKKVTLWDISRVTDPIARSMIMTTLLEAKTRHAQRQQARSGERDRPLQEMLVIEEANQLAPSGSPVAKYIAETHRQARSAGIGITDVVQRPEDLDPEIRANASNRYAFRLPDGGDQAVIQSSLGLTEEEKLHLPNMCKGEVYYAATGSGAAVRGRTFAPEPVPDNGAVPLGPESIVANPEDLPLYTQRERDAANAYARTDPGKFLGFWADTFSIATIGHLGDVPLVETGPTAYKQLAALKEPTGEYKKTGAATQRVRDRVIRVAAEEAVARRSKYIDNDALPHAQLATYIEAKMHASLGDRDWQPPMELPTSKAFKNVDARREIRQRLIQDENNARALSMFTQALAAEEDALNRTTDADSRQEHEATIADLRNKIDTTNTALEGRALNYDPEQNNMIKYPNHPDFVQLSRLFTEENPTNMLIPPEAAGYVLNKYLDRKVSDATQANQLPNWLIAYAAFLNCFDIPADARATLVGDYEEALTRAKAKEDQAKAQMPEGRADKAMEEIADLREDVMGLSKAVRSDIDDLKDVVENTARIVVFERNKRKAQEETQERKPDQSVQPNE